MEGAGATVRDGRSKHGYKGHMEGFSTSNFKAGLCVERSTVDAVQHKKSGTQGAGLVGCGQVGATQKLKFNISGVVEDHENATPSPPDPQASCDSSSAPAEHAPGLGAGNFRAVSHY